MQEQIQKYRAMDAADRENYLRMLQTQQRIIFFDEFAEVCTATEVVEETHPDFQHELVDRLQGNRYRNIEANNRTFTIAPKHPGQTIKLPNGIKYGQRRYITLEKPLSSPPGPVLSYLQNFGRIATYENQRDKVIEIQDEEDRERWWSEYRRLELDKLKERKAREYPEQVEAIKALKHKWEVEEFPDLQKYQDRAQKNFPRKKKEWSKIRKASDLAQWIVENS